MNAYKLTKLTADLIELPDDAEGHEMVRFECEELARPLLLAVVAPPSGLPWKEAVEWCKSVRVGGFEDWACIKPVPAFALANRKRTTYPLVDPSFLPNHADNVIWTDQEGLVPPSGFAWGVSLGSGYAYCWYQGSRHCALACRPGQSI